MSTRRNFLYLSSAALAWATTSSTLLAQAVQRAGIPVFSNGALGASQQGLLTRARFESLIGSSFHLYMDGAVAEIVLQKVLVPEEVAAALRPRTAAAEAVTKKMTKMRPSPDKCFMLQFNTGGVIVPQDSYVLDHGLMGSFTLFLVPNGKTGQAATAVATFNYL